MYSTALSVTKIVSFDAREFVVDESSFEKQAKSGVEIYKVL